tara:strand:+ start:139 stop:651 length:513 start_codon:yes stop_codon:yes gene_type:complete
MNNLVTKLSSIAALLGVVGAIGAGFVQYGKLVSKIEELDGRETVEVDTTSIEVKLKELETQIMNLDNDVLDNLRNDIAGNSNNFKAITQDIIKDIKVIQSVLADAASNDDIDKLDKKLRTPIKELEEYAWELEEDIEENSKNIAIIKKENELQDILIEEVKALSSNPLGG